MVRGAGRMGQSAWGRAHGARGKAKGKTKLEFGPVVVPNRWDYAAVKDAAFDKLRRAKVGKERF
jgi:hypothetical protein